MTRQPLNISRYEIKCLIPLGLTNPVRELSAPYVKPDLYAAARDQHQYTVKSLYYDTQELDFYYEKKDGLKVRKKLRIRAYNDCLMAECGFLEIKRRYVNNVLKERYKMPLREIENMLTHQQGIPLSYKESSNGKAALAKFIYNMERRQLVPTALIVYDREAYVGVDDDTVRLTMDFDVSAKINPHFSDFFSGVEMKPLYTRWCVLELKYNEFMPLWMKKILSSLDILPESVSKYCAGIDAFLI